MNTHFHPKSLCLKVGTILLISTSLNANAFVITDNTDADALANQLIISNSGVTITGTSLDFGVSTGVGGVSISGAQSGLYTNTAGTYGLPGPGIVLSTGKVSDTTSSSSTDYFASTNFDNIATADQNVLLTPLTGQTQHFDPVQLNISFNVDSTVDTISFFAAYGSEEYPDFVNSSFTDGFGLYFNDVNVAGALPTGGVPGDPLLPINIDHPDMSPTSGTVLDGVLTPDGSPVLRFDIPVAPGSTGNTFSMILADASDNAYDTTIFLSSFGDFSSSGGSSEFTPILPTDPSNPTNAEGGFVFELPEVMAFETIWIDPDVSVGYTYVATGGGLFASVTAPSLISVNDLDGYTITYIDQFGNEVTVSLLAGETYSFGVGVESFTLNGIDTDLLVDPTDPAAFATGLSFTTSGTGFGIIQTPISEFVGGNSAVPEPATLALFGLGLAGFIGARKRKN